MKCFFALLTILVCTTVSHAVTTTGTISADETWSGTITVTGDIVVDSGTVTILPGTIIKFATTNDNEEIPFGNPGQIFFGVASNGAVQAVGTADEPITFTTASPFPVPGSWGQIHLMALKNDPVTIFKYCNFEYNRAGIGMRNDDGLDEVSAPIIDRCTFKHFTNSGVYGTSGCAATVTNCWFEDITSAGVFLHGANTVTVRNCVFTDMSVAFINAAISGYEEQHLIIDHCTISGIDYMKNENPKWWTGYGIFNTNFELVDTGYVEVTNSIIANTTLSGMIMNNWYGEYDYNCWYYNMVSIEDGDPGDNSLEADPMFGNPAGLDFRLKSGSPCIGAASDGTDMGAMLDSMPPASIHDKGPARKASVPAVTVSPNPFSATARINVPAELWGKSMVITDLDGKPVRTLALEGEAVSWDGLNTAGQRVSAGVYCLQAVGHVYRVMVK